MSSAEEIPLGEGAIIREWLSKVAAYRDETGSVHRMSSVCPHLGCIVDWNTTEKSWDCPCHGSRFDKSDKVFNGRPIPISRRWTERGFQDFSFAISARISSRVGRFL
ncbi:MAG: Rieske 2Fe-2S domain-containing protein [bacterium]|nr:Rieske 2Fe-2S domain-containing protein [bacterium]